LLVVEKAKYIYIAGFFIKVSTDSIQLAAANNKVKFRSKVFLVKCTLVKKKVSLPIRVCEQRRHHAHVNLLCALAIVVWRKVVFIFCSSLGLA
jgi:hypothetical protein